MSRVGLPAQTAWQGAVIGRTVRASRQIRTSRTGGGMPGVAIVHLDLTAEDLGAAGERAVALGAVVPKQPDPRWRVLLDPAGHPFCLTPFTPDSKG